MRYIPSDVAQKVARKVQTIPTLANPKTNLYVSRPETPITSDFFLERLLLQSDNVTDVSVAVSNPTLSSTLKEVFIAYIDNDMLNVVKAKSRVKMEAHIFYSLITPIQADACSIAFDGTMPKNVQTGNVEFVTDHNPWVFYISGGALYAMNLDTGLVEILADSGCTDVSAIRAMWSEVGSFDFGLIVFFLLNNKIFYRQLIDGEWLDGEAVVFGPDPNALWSEIAATRTWDYRVVLQARDTEGNMYELFSQFEGIAKQNTENINITNINIDDELIPIITTDTANTENININNIDINDGVYYGFTSSIINAYNVEDSTGNWGTTVVFVLDYLVLSIGDPIGWSIVDVNGNIYLSESGELDETRTVLTLKFPDFNAIDLSGSSQVIAKYTPGDTQCYNVPMEASEFTFTVQNLVPPQIDPPKVEVIFNV